jgi:hypothetical protein
MRFAGALVQSAVFIEFIAETGRIEEFVDAAVALADDQIAVSRSFVLLWRTLGSGPKPAAADRLIAMSARMTYGTPEQKRRFWAAMANCVAGQGTDVLARLGIEQRSIALGAGSFVGVSWPPGEWVSDVTGMAFQEHLDAG